MGGAGYAGQMITGLMRVDASKVDDSHSFFLDNNLPGNGSLMVADGGGVTVKAGEQGNAPSGIDPRNNNALAPGGTITAYLNLLRNPSDPTGNATFGVDHTQAFTNLGAGVTWTPFDISTSSHVDKHRLITFIDPTTGDTRLILGDDQGLSTALDDNGTPISRQGRDGNIQITQFYYGAAQPGSLAASIAGALFYGQAQDDGFPASNPNILTPGAGLRQPDLVWLHRRRCGRGHQPVARQREHGRVRPEPGGPLPVQLAVLRRRRHRLLPGQRRRQDDRVDPDLRQQ